MTTRQERRGIASNEFPKKRGTVGLASNLEPARPEPKGDEQRVREFQRKLYQKAKQEPGFRFYVLYDKVCLPHFLREAYRRVRRNHGSPGVDGTTFEAIEASGLEDFLAEIAEELKTETYRPSPVLRRMIPKANGKERPLGIPTIRDRVVQMSCKLAIEPIFEADFEDCSFGFRPKRSSKDAVEEIKSALLAGRTDVFDADLASYFDTIPHDKLLITLGQRISDRRVLKLIKLWLKAPVSENGRMTGGKKSKMGTPQGGVISPLLANVYLHLVDRIVMRKDGYFRQKGLQIVRYADDFVLMAGKIPQEALRRLEKVLARMGLALNKEKSKLLNAKNSGFDFLGFNFRNRWSRKQYRRKYWHIGPSRKSVLKITVMLRELFGKSRHMGTLEFIRMLNEKMRGWANYFNIPGISHPFQSFDRLRWYIDRKLAAYYRRKSQRGSKLYRQHGYDGFVKEFGLIDPLLTLHRRQPANA
jgi:group II intron reverse transcriptase/maturase